MGVNNIKFSIIFILSICFCSYSVAQSIDPGELQKLSKEISSIQNEVNNKNYIDIADGTIYVVSFPKQNFNVFFHNGLGSKAVYKKSDKTKTEVLSVTEGVDFTQMRKLQVVKTPSSDIYVLRAYFPADYLKTKIIENENLVREDKGNFVDFFYLKDDFKKQYQLTLDVYKLILLQKQAKGLPVNEEELEIGQANFELNKLNPSQLLKSNSQKQDTKAYEKPINTDTDRLKNLYNSFVTSGNKYYNNADYKNAQTAYWNAAAIKKDDEYVSNQLLKIDKALEAIAHRNEPERRYDSLMAVATEHFKNKAYDSAEESLRESLKINPQAIAPKDQLKYISAIKEKIAQADKIKQAEDLEIKFKKAVHRGNEAVIDKNYSDAFAAYKEALRIHPDDEWCLGRLKIVEHQLEIGK